MDRKAESAEKTPSKPWLGVFLLCLISSLSIKIFLRDYFNLALDAPLTILGFVLIVKGLVRRSPREPDAG